MKKDAKDELSIELIRVIKERLLEDRTIVGLLMDTLSIGKEAVYRRLRGEVPFTFYEAVLLAKEMGLSLDEIAGNSIAREAMFALNLQKTDNPLEYIYGICHSYYNLYLFIKNDPQSIVSTASRILPFIFHSHYKTLTKFRLCRWIHQYHGIKLLEKINSNPIPDKLTQIMEAASAQVREVATTYILWDQNIFHSLLEDIRYFSELELLSKEEIESLKEELMELLNEMEDVACKGAYANGNKVYIYISTIDFEASYTYIEKPGFKTTLFHLYAIDYIHSQHPDICYEQKRWIESLKRYSTLISQCGEMYRMNFFQKQRNYVTSLLS